MSYFKTENVYRCPVCDGHRQLNCYAGASECCPECTVVPGTVLASGAIELSCNRCGCFWTVAPDRGSYRMDYVPPGQGGKNNV